MKAFLASDGIGNNAEALTNLWSEDSRRIGLIGNAVNYEEPDIYDAFIAEQEAMLRSLGFEPDVMDLRDHFDKPGTAERRIRDSYAGVYVTGGNTFILARGLAQSGLDGEAVRRLFEDQGGTRRVWAAYSAGACILGKNIEHIKGADDETQVPALYQGEPVYKGLGMIAYEFVPHLDAPDQHVLTERLDKAQRAYVTLHDGDIMTIDGDTITTYGNVTFHD